MHTVIVLAGGAALLVACTLLGQAFGSLRAGAMIFVPVWLVVALVNMVIGVRSAGYTYAEEFPIFAAIFLVPAAVAVAIWWLLRPV